MRACIKVSPFSFALSHVPVTGLIQVTVEMDDGAEVAVKLSNLVSATGTQEIGREEGRQGCRVWLRGLVNAADLNGASAP